MHGIPLQPAQVPVRSCDDARGRTRRAEAGIRAIEIGADSWRPELMALHELGHWMDSILGDGPYASSAKRADMLPELRELFDAIRASAAYAASRHVPGLERGKWRRRREMFARADSQWVAWHSGSIRLRRQMDRALRSPRLERRLLHWGYRVVGSFENSGRSCAGRILIKQRARISFSCCTDATQSGRSLGPRSQSP